MTAALRNWGGIGPGSSDADLAVAAADGDRRAFAEIYDRYADRLHDFGIGMLRDRDSAADCVQDAFCIASTSAEWPSGARQAASLAVLHRSQRSPQETPPASAASGRLMRCPMSYRTMRARTRWLTAWSSPTSFPKPQADFPIAIRPCWSWLTARGWTDPSSRWPSASLRRTPTRWSAVLRETIERSLGALLVARRIQSDPGSCPELATVLHGWDGKFNILMRKRIARHIESCDACEDLRSRSVNPAALLAAPVFIPAPAWLKNSVSGTSS